MAREGARVGDVRALSDFRPSLIRFGEDVQRALSSVGSDAGRLLTQLERERLPYWHREIRVRSEAAVVANSKLVQQTSSLTPRPSVDARKAYERAKMRVREAEERLDQTKRAILMLRKEIEIYRGAIQPMASIARADMHSAIGRLDAHIQHLDAYTAGTMERSTDPDVPEESD